MRLALSVVTATLATFFATSASAEPADVTRLLGDVRTVIEKRAFVLDSPRCSPAGCLTDTNATAAQPERSSTNHLTSTGTTLFSAKPRFSLVARDWGSSFRVAGERLALVDTLRLTSSTRMVLARVRLSEDSRISPFFHIGLGQWRTDPFLLPLTARYTEIAAQSAIGIEIRMIGTWRVALETATTMLHRETPRDATDLPSPRMWSTTFGSSVEF